MKIEDNLKAINFVLWIVFAGLIVKSLVILTSFFISLLYPEIDENLYFGTVNYTLKNIDFIRFRFIVFATIAISSLQACIVFLVIKIFKAVNKNGFFTNEIAAIFSKISHFIFGIAILFVFIATQSQTKKSNEYINESAEFEHILILSILFYSFSLVFKKAIKSNQNLNLKINSDEK